MPTITVEPNLEEGSSVRRRRKEGSLSRSTKKYTYKLKRLHPTQWVLLWHYFLESSTNYSMGISQVHLLLATWKQYQPFTKLAYSYKILKSEYPTCSIKSKDSRFASGFTLYIIQTVPHLNLLNTLLSANP